MAFRPVPRLVVASCFVAASRFSSRLIVSCWRLVRVSWVGVLVSALAFRFSFRFSSRLVSAFRVVGRLVSALSCCAVLVSSFSRVISSCLVATVALFVFVSLCVSDGVGSLWRCGEAGRGCRGAGDMGVAWRYAMRGGVAWRGSVMPCRAAECAVSGTGGGTHGEMRGGTMNAPFLSARFNRSHVVITSRGVLGEFSAFSTVE
mgnify:FL=1